MHFPSMVKAQAEPQISSVLFPKALPLCCSSGAASHSSITGPHPAHTFPSLPGIKPVTPVCFSRRSAYSSGEAEWWTVAVSRCLCAWQFSSQPPLCSHQEMSFSNSFSNALNSSLLSSDKAKSKEISFFAVFLHLLHFYFPFCRNCVLQRLHQHLSSAALKRRPLSEICKVMLW